MTSVDKLYENYNALNAAITSNSIEEHENLYVEIINGVKGDKNAKRLASQFICLFYKNFPKLSDDALNALFDLCEDADVEVRKQAIKDLPTICKHNVENVSKITDILVQLLITYDQSELQLVHSSLVTLGKMSPKLFLTGVFSIITNGEEITRERAIKFLQSKIKTLPADFWNKENEEFFLEESRKVLADCTKEEFEIFMNLLKNLKVSRMISGQHILLDIVTKKAELDKEFDANDLENQDRFLLCMKQATPCFSQFVNSNLYVQYVCQQILPKHQFVCEDDEKKENFKLLPIVQAFAEIACHVQPTNKNEQIDLPFCTKSVFDKLLHYLPEPKLPALDTSTASDASDTAAANENDTEDAFEFTYIESLLHVLHSFGRKNKETFIEDIGGAEVMREFKLRLQYLARRCQNYIKSLREDLKQVPAADQLKSEENKLKLIALKCIQNITTLIRDLFYPKPEFKSSVTLSWIEPIAPFTNEPKVTPVAPKPAQNNNRPQQQQTNRNNNANHVNRNYNNNNNFNSNQFNRNTNHFNSNQMNRSYSYNNNNNNNNYNSNHNSNNNFNNNNQRSNLKRPGAPNNRSNQQQQYRRPGGFQQRQQPNSNKKFRRQ